MDDPRSYAIAAHGDQKYGLEPYVVHLDTVAELVRGVKDPSDELEAVAFLHDTLEDTQVSSEDLEAAFGMRVSWAVQLCTDPPGINRKSRKAELHNILSVLDAKILFHRWALVVKTADRLANVRACVSLMDSRLDMYRREYDAFYKATYRPGICDNLWTDLNDLLRA